MNVTLPKKAKTSIKAIIIYTIAVMTCMIALVVIVLSIYLGSDELDRLVTMGKSTTTQEEIEYQNLVSNFDTIFQNKLENSDSENTIQKADSSKELVYTYYTKNESKNNDYDVNLNIPYINIDNNSVDKINASIKKSFENRAETVLSSTGKNIAYTVEYDATIENNILSVIVRSKYKQLNNAQRVIVHTYNYDIANNKQLTLEDVLAIKNLDSTDVEGKIKSRIQDEQKKVEDLKALGYNIFQRNPEDEMYTINQSKEFFIKDGKLYIVYAYGNKNSTSEMDLVII
ncbi:MAG: hypothetical protein ACLS90_04225 [Clostridia bacterium]